MTTIKELREIGFKPLPHFTIMHSLVYDIGRGRHLSIGCVGQPNEICFLCQVNSKDDKEITDLICVHNYDYDGFITLEKVKALIKALTI
jgi:hypothetical protein